MPIDLQKLEQKFNALFEDENTVAEFEQWLEARNVKPALQQTPCTTLLPHPCVDPLFDIKGCDMPTGSCTACGGK